MKQSVFNPRQLYALASRQNLYASEHLHESRLLPWSRSGSTHTFPLLFMDRKQIDKLKRMARQRMELSYVAASD